MIFTRIGKWVAGLGLIFSVINIGLAFVLATDPNQTIMANTGGTIDLNTKFVWGCLLLGVACEISQNLALSDVEDLEDELDGA
jgi:hypothetical protein